MKYRFQKIHRIRLLILMTLVACLTIQTHAQKHAYRLFNEEGKKAKYEKMVEAASEADVVLFGELHNNPISHWLQFELTKDLHHNKGENLVIGAEMFESDNQLILDEYFSGLITESKFEDEARLWNNYKTDYKPLVLLAKENELRFVATNIPRRYANTVFRQGVEKLDELSDEAKKFIAPLPLEYDTSLNCYSQLIHGMIIPGFDSIDISDAQAIKDATMSHFILENWKAGKLFIHYNGAYHSDSHESMNWFLKRANPELKIITISTVEQEDLARLEEESKGKADFIIAVPSSMTKTSR